ncbi:TPA: hypothetical protein NJ520_004361 [Vibrio parahaemolyticus]|nr:hypothetical protein [Vibrio parahaemolyticus]
MKIFIVTLFFMMSSGAFAGYDQQSYEEYGSRAGEIVGSAVGATIGAPLGNAGVASGAVVGGQIGKDFGREYGKRIYIDSQEIEVNGTLDGIDVNQYPSVMEN